MRIGGVLLAAGSSRRFGSADKLLQPIAARPLVRHAAEALCASGLDEIIAVIATESDAVRLALCGLPLRFAIAEGGMGVSIANGVAALNEACDGILIAPADMPLMTATLIRRLVALFVDHGGCFIVHPEHEGVQHPPVIWPRDLRGALVALKGDRGGKILLATNRERARPLVLDGIEARALIDIDTPEDLTRIDAPPGSGDRS